VKILAKIGHHLFRHRAIIAGVAFVLLAIAANPRPSMVGHLAVGIGLLVRSWAAGYMGSVGRRREFQARYVVRNGPYGLLRHPLYLGNFFLVTGILILYNPPRWMGFVYLVLFCVIYLIIIIGEIDHLRGKPVRETCYKLGNLRGEFSTWLVMAIVYSVFFLLLKL